MSIWDDPFFSNENIDAERHLESELAIRRREENDFYFGHPGFEEDECDDD